MKTVKVIMDDAMKVEGELNLLLQQKTKMKLKFELTELLLKIRAKTGPAREIMQEFFAENGKKAGENGEISIPKYKEGTKELTEEFKQLKEMQNVPVEFEFAGITFDLLEPLEAGGSYTELIKLIMENDLKK